MKTLEGRVAVVTGASSGIGLSIVKRFAERGMSVVMASQNAERLARAEAEVSATGADVLAVRADVGRRADIERLAERTLERFEAVHVLVNNAGVYAPGYPWEVDDENWEWVMGVNFWGTVHGMNIFLPHLLQQEEAHVVNVASVGGLLTTPCNGPYTASKHAVVGLTKALRAELAMKQARTGVSLVCPGGVVTNVSSQLETTGPGGKPRHGVSMAPEVRAFFDIVDQTVAGGIPSDDVADMVCRGILENRFWVLPNAEIVFPVLDHELAELKAGIRS